MAIVNVKKRTIPQRSHILEDIHGRSIHIDSREIFVVSHPDAENDEAGVDYRMAEVFLKNLRYLEAYSDDPIIVHFLTDGGDWYYGMAIYDAISLSPCHILSISHAKAMSMSSIMMQGADTRLIMPNCDFMLHGGNVEVSGTGKQFLTYAEWYTKIQERALDIYVSKCNSGSYFRDKEMDDKQIRNFIKNKMDLKEEWYLTPTDTVYYGFADGIVGEEGYETMAKVRENLFTTE